MGHHRDEIALELAEFLFPRQGLEDLDFRLLPLGDVQIQAEYMRFIIYRNGLG